MIRLSRKAWNNVLIFSMLIMIFVFNGLHTKILNNSEQVASQPVFADGQITELRFANVTIERIGVGARAVWQSDDPHTLGQAPGAYLEAWQAKALSLTVAPAVEAPTMVSEVEVRLAGDKETYAIFAYYIDGVYYLYDRFNDLWYALNRSEFTLLFP